MSEKDIERLGNRPFQRYEPPAWWIENKTTVKKKLQTAPRYGRGIASGGRGLQGYCTAIRMREHNNRSSGHILLSEDIAPVETMLKIEYRFYDHYLVVKRSVATDAFLRQNRKHSKGLYYHLPRKLTLKHKIASGIYEAVFDDEIDGVIINLEKKIAP